MSRRIDFEDEALVIRYDGFDSVVRLMREIRVPYESIQSLSFGLADPPRALALKAGLSTPPFGTTQRGRFREHGRWSFFDVDARDRAIVLDLADHKFRRVGLTVDDPPAFAERLHERRPD